MERRRLLVSGRVQGVGFRWFVKRTANDLGIVGWAKNSDEGSVEMEAQGHAEDMELFISLVREGPRWAIVEDIAWSEIPLKDNEKGFHIILW